MSQHVWLKVDDADAWVLAEVVEKTADGVLLKRAHAPEGVALELTLPADDFAKLSGATGNFKEAVEDLAMLQEVSSATLLHTLRLRYAEDLIYTAIGPVIIALNPYRPVDCCASDALEALAKENMQDLERELPPHVFRVSRNALRGMQLTRRAQSVLISGESGAGKTETNKLAMVCLAELTQSSGANVDAVLESGILLEAFGNAKTVYNNNSSRFGKWCAVYFDYDGHIAKCIIRSYLLEKS